MIDFYYFSFDFTTVLNIMALAFFIVIILRLLSRLSIFSSGYDRARAKLDLSNHRLPVQSDSQSNH